MKCWSAARKTGSCGLQTVGVLTMRRIATVFCVLVVFAGVSLLLLNYGLCSDRYYAHLTQHTRALVPAASRLDTGSADVRCLVVPKVLNYLEEKVPTRKIILFLNFPDSYSKLLASNEVSQCDSKCQVVMGKEYINNADAVVFSRTSASSSMKIPEKLPNQTWVFFSYENPVYSNFSAFVDQGWSKKFGLSISYRTDSDLWYGPGRFSRRSLPANAERKMVDQKRWHSNWRMKDKLVAWIVDECKSGSRRENYVDELKKIIDVDTFGRCGSKSCSNYAHCLKEISKRYKFVISFEKALCKDDVSDGFIDVLELNSIVPLVRGGADYKKHFPGSVINTADFKTVEKLASMLKTLANNETAYNNYLEWSWSYSLHRPGTLPVCKLCSILHMRTSMTCAYDSIYAWWSKNTCYFPNDVHWS